MIDSASARVIASGLGLLEGPVAVGDKVYVVSVNRGRIYAVDVDDGAYETVACPGGGPNGLALDAEGRFWIAQNGGTRTKSAEPNSVPPALQALSQHGTVTTLVGTGLDAPNDCAIGPDGRIWFTDPPFVPDHTPQEGRLLGFDPASAQLVEEEAGVLFPNGLAFDVGRNRLYLVETGRRLIRTYRIDSSGRLERLSDLITLPHGDPDGICLDQEGNVYVANGPGEDLFVISPEGDILQHVDFARTQLTGPRYFPTNVCFGGPQRDRLLVTLASQGRIVEFRTSTVGMLLHSSVRSG